jgi:hypothetical protein
MNFMSYIGPIAILLMVVSPLLIPATVTMVHAVGGWRRKLPKFAAVMNRAERRVGPQRLGRQLSRSLAGNTDLRGGRELGYTFAE